VGGPEGVHYEDVLVFTNISESFAITQPSRIRIRWEEQGIYLLPSNVHDLDGNGIYDYVEWVAPRLSNQTFVIILAIAAEHLDENRTTISDIYEYIAEQDFNFSEEIPNGHYVRVTFEENLTGENDITVFGYMENESIGTKVEVYEENGTEIIAVFDPLLNFQYHKEFLTNLTGEQDTFDLRVVGDSVRFDHIIDPTIVYEGGDVESVGISALDDTTFVIAWCEATLDRGFWRIYNPDGTAVSNEVIFIQDLGACGTANYGDQLSVSALNDTAFAITWFDDVNDSINVSVYGTDEALLYGFGVNWSDSAASGSSISAFNDTAFVVGWAGNGVVDDIKARIYDFKGTPLTDEILVDGDVGVLGRTVAVDTFNDTAFVITWFDYGGAPDQDITYQIYDNTGASV